MGTGLRVLFDHQIFSQQDFGGISRYFVELVRHLRLIPGVEPRVALRFSKNHYLRQLGLKQRMPFVQGLDFRGRRRLQLSVNRVYARREIRRDRFDIFHPTYYDPYFFDELGSRPFVLTVFDMTHHLFPELFPAEPQFQSWVKATVASATTIIAISEHTKADLVRFFPSVETKVEVVPLAATVDLTSGRTDVPALPEKFILFVGSRVAYKNFRLFAQAAANIMRLQRDLFVVCAGGGRFTREETELLRSLLVDDRIVQLTVSDHELAAVYRAALCLAYPSRYEGFGLPVLEAFSTECPVVAHAASAIPEVAGDAAVYFADNDLESLERALCSVIASADLREELRQRGTRRARAFSWEDTAAKTFKVYASAVGHV